MKRFCPKCFKGYPEATLRCERDGTPLVSPEERDLTGHLLDNRYTVLERIGRGGMGVVYKARQHLLGRAVALKVLRPEVVEDEVALRRFMTEAQAIASLSSRHTVTLYDFGITRDGLLFYTMELLQGRVLSRIIQQEGALNCVRAADFAMQVCHSLEEAHGHGILHRDIKPDNLYVVSRRGREVVKVLDFGIAKLAGNSSIDTLTRTGFVVGTPVYLSPEQALDSREVPASDLYSLGVVLYEMLAGVPPFYDSNPVKTMWAHVKDPVPRIRTRNPQADVPEDLERFLVRALAKEPAKRYASAAEFRHALRDAVATVAQVPAGTTADVFSTSSELLLPKTSGPGASPIPPAPAPPEAPFPAPRAAMPTAMQAGPAARREAGGGTKPTELGEWVAGGAEALFEKLRQEELKAARALMADGQYEAALARLSNIWDVAGDDAEVRSLMESCYAQIRAREVGKFVAGGRAAMVRRDFDAAARAFSLALKLDPENAEIRKLLDQCRSAGGSE
jgi:serine/threonine-protein kinase